MFDRNICQRVGNEIDWSAPPAIQRSIAPLNKCRNRSLSRNRPCPFYIRWNDRAHSQLTTDGRTNDVLRSDAPLRTAAVAKSITDKQHPAQQFWSNRRATCIAVKGTRRWRVLPGLTNYGSITRNDSPTSKRTSADIYSLIGPYLRGHFAKSVVSADSSFGSASTCISHSSLSFKFDRNAAFKTYCCGRLTIKSGQVASGTQKRVCDAGSP